MVISVYRKEFVQSMNFYEDLYKYERNPNNLFIPYPDCHKSATELSIFFH